MQKKVENTFPFFLEYCDEVNLLLTIGIYVELIVDHVRVLLLDTDTLANSS